nr:recombinase family protein [Kordia sp.]
MTKIFRNPIYCGLVAYNLLDGEIVQGKHPAIVSKELFLKANDLQAINPHGYKQTKVNDNLPLRGGFLRCEKCEKALTGYVVKKKNVHYYKCRTKGCRCNKNANALNSQFIELLSSYKIDKKLIAPLKLQLKNTFEYFSKSNEDNTASLKYNLKTIKANLDQVEERYAIGKIDLTIYEKYLKKYQERIEEITVEINKTSFEKSNLDSYIDKSLELACNLHNIWELGNHSQKQKLQNLLFPNGILYSKENDRCRTTKVNSVLELINSLSVVFDSKKGSQKNKNVDFSHSLRVKQV